MSDPALRVYLDTSILGGYFDIEFRHATRRLWRLFSTGRLVPLLGHQTLDELAAAPTRVQRLAMAIPGAPAVLQITVEVRRLADAYLAAGAVPPGSVGDAVHVATAVVHGVLVLLSWNFRHLANVRRNRAFNATNLTAGYAPIDIRSPLEVIEDEDHPHDD